MTCITIDGVKIEDRILSTKFACDYEKCKGACCNAVFPDFELDGASLTLSEKRELFSKREDIAKFCDETNYELIMKAPTYRCGTHEFTGLDTRGVCVFMNNKKCTCGLKLTREEGITSFAVPQSCELYPLGITNKDGIKYLELWDTFDDYCRSGYEKGERNNIYLIDFCKNAIIRAFDEGFYTELKRIQQKYLCHQHG